MSNTSILVLGAGTLGLSILRALSSPSSSLTVLLRPSTLTSPSPTAVSKIAELRTLGVSILPFDLLTSLEASLAAIFTPYPTIIAATSVAVLKVVRAVLAARTPRFFPWQFGVDYDVVGLGSGVAVWDDQFLVRQLLRGQSGTKWVIISTGMFMEFLLSREFGVVDVEKGVVRALGGWDVEVTVTATRDVGRVVAEVVFAVPEVRDEVLFVGGDRVTFERLAEVVERVLGRKLEREVWTREELGRELEKRPRDEMAQYRWGFAGGEGRAWDVEGTWNQRSGMEMTGIEGFVRERLGGKRLEEGEGSGCVQEK